MARAFRLQDGLAYANCGLGAHRFVSDESGHAGWPGTRLDVGFDGARGRSRPLYSRRRAAGKGFSELAGIAGGEGRSPLRWSPAELCCHEPGRYGRAGDGRRSFGPVYRAGEAESRAANDPDFMGRKRSFERGRLSCAATAGPAERAAGSAADWQLAARSRSARTANSRSRTGCCGARVVFWANAELVGSSACDTPGSEAGRGSAGSLGRELERAGERSRAERDRAARERLQSHDHAARRAARAVGPGRTRGGMARAGATAGARAEKPALSAANHGRKSPAREGAQPGSV